MKGLAFEPGYLSPKVKEGMGLRDATIWLVEHLNLNVFYRLPVEENSLQKSCCLS
jgi:hypothetical protein